jgi:hypothetical protein
MTPLALRPAEPPGLARRSREALIAAAERRDRLVRRDRLQRDERVYRVLVMLGVERGTNPFHATRAEIAERAFSSLSAPSARANTTRVIRSLEASGLIRTAPLVDEARGYVGLEVTIVTDPELPPPLLEVLVPLVPRTGASRSDRKLPSKAPTALVERFRPRERERFGFGWAA